MPRFVNPDEMEWAVGEVPLSAGVDLRQPARLVKAPSLLVGDNLRFDSGASTRKRRGHTGSRVRDMARLAAGQSTGSWLFGRGVSGTSLLDVTTASGPDAGKIAGVAKKDDEVLVWDGWRLFSYPAGVEPAGGWQTPVSAVIPHTYTAPVAKLPTTQSRGDIGITDRLGVVAWIDTRTVAGTTARMSVYDPVTWAPYTVDAQISLGGATPRLVRVVPCGDWVYILVSANDNTLHGWALHPSNPATPVAFTDVPGSCDTYFDVRKMSETRWVLVRADSAGALRFSIYGTGPGLAPSPSLYNLDAAVGYTVKQVAVAAHPLTNEWGIVWVDAADTKTVHGRLVGGTESFSAIWDHTFADDVTTLATEARYTKTGDFGNFQAFVSTTDGASHPVTVTFDYQDTAAVTATRYYGQVASQAWRVGDSVFVTLARVPWVGSTTLQQSYYVCDAGLKPVGRLEYGTASNPLSSNYQVPSVHPDRGGDWRNNTKFHSLLSYRSRVDSADDDQYDEDGFKRVAHDFLPPLRSAQLGRATYFAGAQCGMYDGQNYVEAGFHEFPEHVTTSTPGAGNLSIGDYVWKVRWAYKTAGGEEVLSAETFSDTLTIAGGTKKGSLTIPTLPFTRKGLVYALVYRREVTGTNWYLVSNRDPSVTTGDNACPINDPTAPYISFTDNLADTSIISHEVDTIGNSGALELFSPPASQVIGVGRDRLWLAGGELAPGDILPSLTFTAGRGVAFNGFLETTVDRLADPVTAFGFLGNSTLIFKRARIYAFEADGPNNLGSGGFDTPRVVSTDAGAQTQESLVLASEGLYFQGPGHITLLGFNYQMVDVGLPVHDQSGRMTVAAAVLLPSEHEIRFYSATDAYPTLVLNLHYKEWTTWSGLTCGGATVRATSAGDRAYVGRPDGVLLVETDNLWTDAGRGIRVTWRLAWLYPEALQGFQSVRKVALLGDLRGAHVLRIRAFYDDRDYPESVAYWDALGSGDLNDDTWGASNWGDGVWGDTETDVYHAKPRDRVFQVRRGLRRQKCSRVSFEITDGGARTEGPAITALAIEYGRRGGLARVSRTMSDGTVDGGGTAGGGIPTVHVKA